MKSEEEIRSKLCYDYENRFLSQDNINDEFCCYENLIKEIGSLDYPYILNNKYFSYQ